MTLVVYVKRDDGDAQGTARFRRRGRATTLTSWKAINDGVLTPLNEGRSTSKTRIRLQASTAGMGRGWPICSTARSGRAGTVIAPTVEVAYAKDVWHSEGLSGWWVTSPK